jgi:A/G-specific adenine glycosylase
MKQKLTSRQIRSFRRVVYRYYRANARLLPWRNTRDPYKILVSEMMLQQTQVDRVLPKYKLFIKRFPTVKKLAAVSLSQVLELWQGLGYNRRAKFLHEAVIAIHKKYKDSFPQSESLLRTLPGVGSYTAAALCAFAYNKPVLMIETNIRQVFLYHFFQNKTAVDDAEIFGLIEQVLDRGNPRAWYWAMMDYGNFLKKTHGNITVQSKHYVKQSRFEGSRRQLRGNILRLLLKKPMNFEKLLLATASLPAALQQIMQQMKQEKLVTNTKSIWRAG